MTYAKKYGKYGIYTDGILFKWFKNLENAETYWKENVVVSSGHIEEWLDEYDSVKLVNMKTCEVIEKI